MSDRTRGGAARPGASPSARSRRRATRRSRRRSRSAGVRRRGSARRPRVLRLAPHRRGARRCLERLRRVRGRLALSSLLRRAAAGRARPPPARGCSRSRAACCRPPSSRCVRAGGRPRQGLRDRRAVFVRETGPARRDHFCSGRLFQPTLLLLRARRRGPRDSCSRGLVAALRETWGWARPWLPARFDADGYGHAALSASRCAGRCAPSRPGRADQLWHAQRALQTPVLEVLLDELARRVSSSRWREPAGHLVGGTTGDGASSGCGSRAYFRLSIVRATAPLAEAHGELRGLARVHRAEGEPPQRRAIELTERERRFPLLFLWGRVYRHLTRPARARRRTREPRRCWCSRSSSDGARVDARLRAAVGAGARIPTRRTGSSFLLGTSVTSWCTG